MISFSSEFCLQFLLAIKAICYLTKLVHDENVNDNIYYNNKRKEKRINNMFNIV